MRRDAKALILFGLLVLVFSCAKKPLAPTLVLPPEWGYEKGAIRLHLKADPQLNLYAGNSHTVLLCVYHLRDSNAFNQLANEKDGIPKLLECSRFDPVVTHVRRLVVQPGQELSESMDRAEGARYVGIAVGYYQLQKERAVRIFRIPVVQERKGDTLVSKPSVLNIDLLLGAQEISEIRGK